MQPSPVQSATRAAVSCATALGLAVEDATVLHASNRVTVRLLPCGTVARVAPLAYRPGAEFEIELARRLAEIGCPVAALEPRLEPRAHVQGDFIINFWTYYPSPGDVVQREYARALARLHASLRQLDLATPHFTDRVGHAQRLVDTPADTPQLTRDDRAFLSATLRDLQQAIQARGAPEQILHGEPHPGNLLNTRAGPVFIDLETCCRGPIEFDIAYAPDDVAQHYPGLDPDLLRNCRLLKLAMVAAWRWDRNDHFPNGRQMGIDLLSELRLAFEGQSRASQTNDYLRVGVPALGSRLSALGSSVLLYRRRPTRYPVQASPQRGLRWSTNQANARTNPGRTAVCVRAPW